MIFYFASQLFHKNILLFTIALFSIHLSFFATTYNAMDLDEPQLYIEDDTSIFDLDIEDDQVGDYEGKKNTSFFIYFLVSVLFLFVVIISYKFYFSTMFMLQDDLLKSLPNIKGFYNNLTLANKKNFLLKLKLSDKKKLNSILPLFKELPEEENKTIFDAMLKTSINVELENILAKWCINGV